MATDIAFALVLSLRASSAIQTILGTSDAAQLKARIDTALAAGVTLPAIAVHANTQGDDGSRLLGVAVLEIRALAGPAERSKAVAIQAAVRDMLHDKTSFGLGSGSVTATVHYAQRQGGMVPFQEEQSEAWIAQAAYEVTYIEA